MTVGFHLLGATLGDPTDLAFASSTRVTRSLKLKFRSGCQVLPHIRVAASDQL